MAVGYGTVVVAVAAVETVKVALVVGVYADAAEFLANTILLVAGIHSTDIFVVLTLFVFNSFILSLDGTVLFHSVVWRRFSLFRKIELFPTSFERVMNGITFLVFIFRCRSLSKVLLSTQRILSYLAGVLFDSIKIGCSSRGLVSNTER